MLLRMALFFLNYPVRISQKSCRATYILPNFFADKAFAVFLAEPVADFLAVCTTATMFAVHFKKSMTALEGKPGV